MNQLLQYTISWWRLKGKLRTYIAWSIKLLVLCLVLTYLVNEIQHLELRLISSSVLQIRQSDYGLWLLLSVVLLMPVNWFLEAKKWQVLARPFQKISIWESFNGVLSGLSLGFVTPHALGDYAGKAFSISHQKRELILAPVFIGRASQLLMTLLFGLFGLITVFNINSSSPNPEFILYILVGLLLSIISFIYLLRKKNFSFLIKLKPIRESLKVIQKFSKPDLWKVISYSFFRYLVFCIQFLLVLFLFEIPLNTWLLFLGVTWIFLVKSTLPSFNFLSDLGIREFSAVYFFSHFQVDELSIISASLTLWIINLLIPSIMGSFFLLKMKIFK